MPTIIWFLTIAALVLGCLLIRHAVVAFSGLLIAGAALGACAGNTGRFTGMAFPECPTSSICSSLRG